MGYSTVVCFLFIHASSFFFDLAISTTFNLESITAVATTNISSVYQDSGSIALPPQYILFWTVICVWTTLKTWGGQRFNLCTFENRMQTTTIITYPNDRKRG